jgi:hypothetical protein
MKLCKDLGCTYKNKQGISSTPYRILKSIILQKITHLERHLHEYYIPVYVNLGTWEFDMLRQNPITPSLPVVSKLPKDLQAAAYIGLKDTARGRLLGKKSL